TLLICNISCNVLRPHPRSTLFPYTSLFRSSFHFSEEAITPAEACATMRSSPEHEHDSGRAATFTRSAPVQSKDAALRDRNLRRRSEEHTSELQSRGHLVCRLLLEKKKRPSA